MLYKQKIFNVGDVVEAELNKYDTPRHYYHSFFPGTGIWAVGLITGIDNEGDGNELVVQFNNENIGEQRFPLAGHKELVENHWNIPGCLKHYSGGATRDPHCQYTSIIELGAVPYSSLNEDHYRTHFRRMIQNNYRAWPICKIEQKTLDIKYYNLDNREVIATFECQYCCM